MTIETEVYTLPAHWAPALINLDYSGYEQEELDQINQMLEWIASRHYGQAICVGDEGEVGFTNLHDAWRFGVLACEAMDFVFDVTDRREKPKSTTQRLDPSKHRETYEARWYEAGVPYSVEYVSEEQAKAKLEEVGGGELIKWLIERNLPGAMPDYVHKSLGLEVLENGTWKSVNIFGW